MTRALSALRSGVAPLALLVGIIVTWQMYTAWASPPELVLPSPYRVIEELATVWRLGLLADALVESFSSLVRGMALPLVLGVGLGILVGLSSLLDVVVKPYLWALFATPGVAILPLFILWFGIGEGTKLAMIFISTLLPMTMAVADGVRNIDRRMIRVAVIFGADRIQLTRQVLLPSLLPNIGVGMRIGISRSFVALLFVEMLLSRGGLGTEVMRASSALNTPRMMAFVFVLMTLGVLLINAFRVIERYLGRWREEAAL